MSKPQGISAEFDKIRADYDMSRQSRFIRRRTGVAPQGGSADYHYRTESKYYDDMEQARDMDRNDSLVGTLADRRVDNIVQQGFSLDVKTGDDALDTDLEARWQDYACDPEQCDIAGELCWHEIERVVCRAESIDGDMVVTGTEDGPFQTIEAHSIQTNGRMPDTFLGVTQDKYGKRLQYHVRYDLNEFGQKSDSEPLEVRDVGGVRQLFHIYNPKRVSSTRVSLSWLRCFQSRECSKTSTSRNSCSNKPPVVSLCCTNSQRVLQGCRALTEPTAKADQKPQRPEHGALRAFRRAWSITAVKVKSSQGLARTSRTANTSSKSN
jgi:hypothetical protein